MGNTTDIKAQALAAARQRAETRRQEAETAFYSNEKLVDMELRKINRTENIEHLQAMMDQINGLPAVRLPEIGEIRINALATTKGYFKSEIAMLMAVVAAARSAFVDEHREAVLAILNTDVATIEDLTDAIGQPAYWSKRNLTDMPAVAGDYENAKELLQMFASSIGLHELDMSKFTKEAYNRWFQQAELTVERKKAELERTLTLDKEYGAFTITE